MGFVLSRSRRRPQRVDRRDGRRRQSIVTSEASTVT